MSWTCQCTATNDDEARFCAVCGQPFAPAPTLDAPPPPPPMPDGAVPPGMMPPGMMPPAKPAAGNGMKYAAVALVLVLGAIFGTAVAVTMANGGSSETVQASPSPQPQGKSSFQDAFDSSFSRSCRQSAIRSGASQSAADSYCDCALRVFNETHNMLKVVQTCKGRMPSRY